MLVASNAILASFGTLLAKDEYPSSLIEMEKLSTTSPSGDKIVARLSLSPRSNAAVTMPSLSLFFFIFSLSHRRRKRLRFQMRSRMEQSESARYDSVRTCPNSSLWRLGLYRPGQLGPQARSVKQELYAARIMPPNKKLAAGSTRVQSWKDVTAGTAMRP